MLKIIKLFYFILFIFLYNSCQNNKETSYKKNKSQISLKYKRTIKLPLDTLTDAGTVSYQHFVEKGKNYYIHFNESTQSIYVFDYDNQKLDFTVSLPKGDKGKIQQPTGFYVHNFDSIFIPSTAHQAMFLLNKKGQVVKKYPYAEKIDDTNLNEVRFFVSYYSALFLDNKLYCIGAKASVAILNLNTDKWEYKKELPKKFDEGVWTGNYYADTYQNYNKESNKFYYSYANLDYIYNSIKDEKSKIYAGSKYFEDSNIKPFPKGNTKIPFEERRIKFLQTPSYQNFIYDQYRKMYYRIANLPMTNDEIKNIPKQNQRKAHSIIVLDKDMQKVGEIDLPKYEYGVDIMCTREGINIFNRKKLNKDEDAIYFDVFEVVETKK